MDREEIVKETAKLLRKYLRATLSDITGDLRQYADRLAAGIVTYAELKAQGETRRAAVQLRSLRNAAQNVGTIVALREARRWRDAIQKALELAANIAVAFLTKAMGV